MSLFKKWLMGGHKGSEINDGEICVEKDLGVGKRKCRPPLRFDDEEFPRKITSNTVSHFMINSIIP